MKIHASQLRAAERHVAKLESRAKAAAAAHDAAENALAAAVRDLADLRRIAGVDVEAGCQARSPRDRTFCVDELDHAGPHCSVSGWWDAGAVCAADGAPLPGTPTAPPAEFPRCPEIGPLGIACISIPGHQDRHVGAGPGRQAIWWGAGSSPAADRSPTRCRTDAEVEAALESGARVVIQDVSGQTK